MKRVIIESPFRGENAYQQERNHRYALMCLKDSLARNEAPFMSHLLYTQVLNERVQEERDFGINTGLIWGECAELTAVYTDNGISEGMQKGIDHAVSLNRPVEYRKVANSCEIEKFEKARLSTILQKVSYHFDIPMSLLSGKCSKRNVVDARHVYCAVAKDLNPKSTFSAIGDPVRMEHSSVMSAIEQVRRVKEKHEKYNQFCTSKAIRQCLPSQQN
jgi:hypothetical protein